MGDGGKRQDIIRAGLQHKMQCHHATTVADELGQCWGGSRGRHGREKKGK